MFGTLQIQISHSFKSVFSKWGSLFSFVFSLASCHIMYWKEQHTFCIYCLNSTLVHLFEKGLWQWFICPESTTTRRPVDHLLYKNRFDYLESKFQNHFLDWSDQRSVLCLPWFSYLSSPAFTTSGLTEYLKTHIWPSVTSENTTHLQYLQIYMDTLPLCENETQLAIHSQEQIF